ncbi:MAG: bifunctional phosphopantothenoylcysteine decarboxylase/phosphopantothenate--cysteine ligase CoaBC [Actinomycetes bacterium]
MNTLPRGREIILGIGGGVAAYKSAELLRRLQDHGFLVTVIPTSASLNFVGEATWEALSGRPVQSSLWNNVHKVPHIRTAEIADAIVVAPATADLIARIASGRADDFLTNVILASDAPLLLVPAMHPQMWLNEATIANVQTLRSRGITVLEPDIGRLTGKDSGVGRFPEVTRIISSLQELLLSDSDLLGHHLLITAGGTREPIDPVRYIGNRSSGKQGYALAFAAAKRGAVVTLISANVQLPDIEGIETIHVETALQMFAAVSERFPKVRALIMTAAVADSRPTNAALSKIAKNDLGAIETTLNPDILLEMSRSKTSEQILVGFAAETSKDELVERGTRKLIAKGADLLFVNDVSDGAIFGTNETAGWILAQGQSPIAVASATKASLANQLLDSLALKLGYAND